MKSLRFFKCEHCGNVVVKLVEKGVPVFCCGQKMEEIFANTVDAAVEKHLPVLSLNGEVLDVKVGEILHPMEEVHYINFIAVETGKGCSIVSLLPGQVPEVKVFVGDSKVVAVYEYCNLHGLWRTEFK